MRNTLFSKTNELFLASCKLANVPPTTRQASKYRMHKGIVFKSVPKLKAMPLANQAIINRTFPS
jgi:hypothetical protein